MQQFRGPSVRSFGSARPVDALKGESVHRKPVCGLLRVHFWLNMVEQFIGILMLEQTTELSSAKSQKASIPSKCLAALPAVAGERFPRWSLSGKSSADETQAPETRRDQMRCYFDRTSCPIFNKQYTNLSWYTDSGWFIH